MGGKVVQKESGRIDGGVSLFVQCDVSQDETCGYTASSMACFCSSVSGRAASADIRIQAEGQGRAEA